MFYCNSLNTYFTDFTDAVNFLVSSRAVRRQQLVRILEVVSGSLLSYLSASASFFMLFELVCKYEIKNKKLDINKS